MYEIIDVRRVANKDAMVGETVYLCRGYDYGCASDDTRATGIEHVSVTYKEDGEYPFFTIPRGALRKIK